LIRHNTGGVIMEDITVNGQWWRLVSYCFVHGGIIHLGMNMFVLYMFGSLVEKMWGRARFLILYLVSGMGGAVLQLVVQPNGPQLVGASGCLCGLLGSMGVWVIMNRPYLPAKLASSWMNNLIMNVMLIAFISLVPGVSWAGHLGGGIAGAVVSVPLVWSLYGEGAKRSLGWAGTAAVPLACVLILYQAIAPEREQARAEEQEKALVSDPELPRARQEYGPALRAVDRIAATAFERYARPFLTGGETPKADAEDVKAARAAFSAAQTQLKAQIDRLGAIRAFENPLLRRHVEVLKECAGKMSTFFANLSERLTPAPGWPERRAESNREWQEILTLWSQKVRTPLYDLLHQ
jgi:membrane associated rhomboid family serine protease